MTPAQCKAARRLLGWRVTDLAERSRISTTTIVKFERGERRANVATLDVLQRALEAGGVEIVAPSKPDREASEHAIELTDGSVIRLRRVK